MSDDRQAEHFDHWASTYDRVVRRSDRYPFAGYEEIHQRIVDWSEPRPADRILDLGIGTGNLAERFVDRVAEIWGVDFSARMADIATDRLPCVKVVQADLLAAWPQKLPGRFDRIVSAYVFHHFADETKISLLDRLAARLAPGGRIVIGDIAFPTRQAMEEVRDRSGSLWDPDEFPWIAESILPRLTERWQLEFESLSFCGGVIRLRPSPGANRESSP